MNEKAFFESIQSLRETVNSLRGNVEKLAELKKSHTGTTPFMDQPEVNNVLKRNVVDIVDLRMKHRDIQIVRAGPYPGLGTRGDKRRSYPEERPGR